MRGELEFYRLLRQYGNRELVEPLGIFGRIANEAEDAPEHVVLVDVTQYGPASARAFWKFLLDLPAAMKAPTTAAFVIGHEPLVPCGHADLDKWDQWLDRLYQMSMERVPAKPGDGSSIKYREEFLKLIYDELNPFLIPRISFWLKESGVKEDLNWIEGHGRV